MTGPTRAKLRVTFLTVMPSPYMRDLFEAMARDPRFELRVKYLEREAVAAPGVFWKDRPLPEYASVLPGRWYRFWRARVHVNAGVISSLRRDRAQVVVVCGYFSVTTQVAMWWLGLGRAPWVFWGEVPGFERRGRAARTLRWLAQRGAVWLPGAVAAIGRRAATAYRPMVPPGRPVWNIPYTCDLSAYAAPAPRVRTGAGTRFLYCGQLVHRKGVDLLVRAFAAVAVEHPGATLTLVGGGPLRDELEALIPAAVRGRVRFVGFREPEELPEHFAAADAFVLPSRHDGWGLVVNQALGAGLPVIASSAVGAAADLVRDGVNGVVFPSGDETALAAALRTLCGSPDRAAAFGAASRAMAEQINPDRVIDRWYELCAAVAARRAAGLTDRLTL
jgi:glycosyltransferase involved in cell wall biosynthesis